MSRRVTLLVSLAIAALAAAALVAAASQRVDVRTFALRAPPIVPVGVLQPGQRACEGPIVTPFPARELQIWGAPTSGTARLRIEVLPARAALPLAADTVPVVPATAAWTASFPQAVPAHRQLQVCVVDQAGAFQLSGSAAADPRVLIAGDQARNEFSLLLFSGRTRSLLSWLPTAFARASLWRPQWVGPWTFWLLLAGLGVALVLGALAVTAAADSDGRESQRGEGERGQPPPSGPSGNGARISPRRLVRRS